MEGVTVKFFKFCNLKKLAGGPLCDVKRMGEAGEEGIGN